MEWLDRRMEYPKPLPREVHDELVYLATMHVVQIEAVLQVLREVARAAGLPLDVNQLFLEARAEELREALASRLYAEIVGHGG